MNQQMCVSVTIYIDKDGSGYHAWCPALRGFHVDADSEREAIEVAENAAEAYFNSLIKHKDPLPLGVEIKPGFTGSRI